MSATIHEVQWYPSYFELGPSSAGEESPVSPVLYLHRPMWKPGVPHSFSEGFCLGLCIPSLVPGSTEGKENAGKLVAALNKERSGAGPDFGS